MNRLLRDIFSTGTPRGETRGRRHFALPFIREGLWDSVHEKLGKRDFLIIQFGHNDEKKEKGDRYTPPDLYRTNRQLAAPAVEALQNLHHPPAKCLK